MHQNIQIVISGALKKVDRREQLLLGGGVIGQTSKCGKYTLITSVCHQQ
jgi:hypothetical protein